MVLLILVLLCPEYVPGPGSLIASATPHGWLISVCLHARLLGFGIPAAYALAMLALIRSWSRRDLA